MQPLQLGNISQLIQHTALTISCHCSTQTLTTLWVYFDDDEKVPATIMIIRFYQFKCTKLNLLYLSKQLDK